MSDPTPLQAAETRIYELLNGENNPLTPLERLIMLKMLRLEFPYQSTIIRELDAAISAIAKRADNGSSA